MLKPGVPILNNSFVSQPPLGGCVLKLKLYVYGFRRKIQPPLGGCVLKLSEYLFVRLYKDQPPLGGCVLKLQ